MYNTEKIKSLTLICRYQKQVFNSVITNTNFVLMKTLDLNVEHRSSIHPDL